jgi:tRNA threonylcarbamoyl adenosine modification protein YeaZ
LYAIAVRIVADARLLGQGVIRFTDPTSAVGAGAIAVTQRVSLARFDQVIAADDVVADRGLAGLSCFPQMSKTAKKKRTTRAPGTSVLALWLLPSRPDQIRRHSTPKFRLCAGDHVKHGRGVKPPSRGHLGALAHWRIRWNNHDGRFSALLLPPNYRPNHARMLLAFECVARTASACVDIDGREVAYADLAGGEAEKSLVPLLDGLIRAHGLPSALALAAGPGSFTGLRIGAVAARTLAWLEKIPVHAVDTLAARAAEAGDGLWWVLLPLKRDTTFHGLFEVVNGQVNTLQVTQASEDVSTPALHPRTQQAVAIGTAIASKPSLAATWCPGIRTGNAGPLTARGVARLALQVPARSWGQVLPAYHQLSAPEIQRAQALEEQAKLRRTNKTHHDLA